MIYMKQVKQKELHLGTVNHHLFEGCREQALYIHAYSDFVGFHTYEQEVINVVDFGHILPMVKA